MPHSVAPSTADPSLNVPPNDGFIDNDKLVPINDILDSNASFVDPLAP